MQGTCLYMLCERLAHIVTRTHVVSLVEVDAVAKTLRFRVNNKAHGVAFNLPSGIKISGALSMFDRHASVTCIKPQWRNKLYAKCPTVTLGVKSSLLTMTKGESNENTGATTNLYMRCIPKPNLNLTLI